MKDNIVLRWTLSAVVILVIVIGGYSVYASLAEPAESEHAGHEMSEETEDLVTANEEDGHGNHGTDENMESSKTEIVPSIHYENKLIHIELKDKEGNPEDNLEVNHEKIMHLIIVSDDLQQYYHLHPEKQKKGVFTVSHELAEGNYKAFIDIKPRDKAYAVEPLPIEVGKAEDHRDHAELKPDSNFTKTVNGLTVSMSPTEFKTNEETVLDFDLDGVKPDPYLGALGHVVILDEKGNKYVHVHPASETQTKFATKFGQPGLYKIWGEFKVNGKVNVFPFVVEVK
jgi:hypothetical protein